MAAGCSNGKIIIIDTSNAPKVYKVLKTIETEMRCLEVRWNPGENMILAQHVDGLITLNSIDDER